MGGILRANLFTRFNAILGGLLLVVAAVGPPQDGLFVLVPLVNSGIGVVQELRARRTLAALAVVTAPRAHVLRGTSSIDLPVDAVAVGDVIQLRPGDQVVADGPVLGSAGLQVDESLITGEAEPVSKPRGTAVLSGAFVVGGTGTFRAETVGVQSYARSLEAEARTFKLVRSELQSGTNRILRWVTWVLIPAAALLVTSQVLRSGSSLDAALRGSVAGVGAMIPEGLVLLTSIAFALGAIRLAGRRVLVQTLPAVEALARVDVVCVDKTGTLTAAAMRVAGVDRLTGRDPLPLLGTLAGAEAAPNETLRALAAAFPPAPGLTPVGAVPFTSARRWSGVDLGAEGAWVLGAAEALLAPDQLEGRLGELLGRAAEAGERVVLLAMAPAGLAEDGARRPLRPEALVRLAEELRPEAAATVAFLTRQGIEIKVLSGDDPRTVAAVARQVGVPGSGIGVDASRLEATPDGLAAELEAGSVFGRVDPHRKRAMIAALQARGHVVAMTGDGVNDVAALKQADIGIAMGTGSQASRAVAQVVLLDSSFAAVPEILAEGRRVIANVERVAGVVVTKTVYAAMLALAIGAVAVPFPFYPRHLTIVSAVTIGIPGLFLALGRRGPRARPGFTSRVMAFTLPAGICAGAAVLGTYYLARHHPGTSLAQDQTAAAFAVFLVGLWVLLRLSRPLNWLRGGMVAGMVLLAAAAAATPLSRQLFSLYLPPPDLLAEAGAVSAGAVLVAIAWLELAPHLRPPAREAGHAG